MLDGVIDSEKSSYTTVNQLEIRSTPRSFKGAHLECRASSSELAGFVARDVPLIVLLKPNKVKIVTPNDLLSTRKSQTVRCESSGSSPPAKLTWLLDGRAIRNAVVTEEETDTFTGSLLTLNVSPDDDGKELVCRADNPRFPGGSAEDRRQIHVAYPPKISVKIESPSPWPTIKEGMNITLKCETSARPEPYSYSWYLDSHLLPYNETAGILPMDQILQLQNIQQNSGGSYACSAINSEGETYSAPLELKVQYAPRCRQGHEVRYIGAVPFETITASCLVDAFPEVNRFTWTYNTSNGVLPMQSGKMDNTGNSSILMFSPKEGDVESLACWAKNSVGSQTVPCLFYIVPAETPETPKSCIVKNATQGGGLEVSCIAGKDGGLHQSFILEVSDVSAPLVPPGVTTMSDQGELPPPMYRVLGERPVFRLPNLEPFREYRFAVYAENAKGRSEPPAVLPSVRIEAGDQPLQPASSDGTARRDPSNELAFADGPAAQGSSNLTLIIVSAAAVAVTLIVSIIAAASILACRRTNAAEDAVRRRGRRSSKPPDEFDLSEDGFGEGFHRRSAQYRASMYGECEDRITRMIEGPDLILAPYTIRSSQQSIDF
ncbi:unnamed protein product [Callosobruchus maculatus]|uniref:Ig-like domain-containing protein n=1 Tax=Callosobruchus maculatus TaxID=64391 RepID=A0A653DVS6_CALMS|nr:unnamed protein product [Callosobruchus maculatus]